MTDIRKSVLRSVRLDDDVWGAVKAMECSLNQYLREALLGGVPASVERRDAISHGAITDPTEIPGVVRGAASLPTRPETSRERVARERAEKEARIRARSSIGDDPSFVADPEYAQD